MKKGKLIAFVGSMKSGKSEELIKQCKRYMYAKQKVVLFKPKRDTRTEDEVVSRNGERLNCFTIENISEIGDIVTFNHKVIGIDELHMFALTKEKEQEVIDTLNHLIDLGFIVLIAGLDMDYLGRPFNVIPDVMAIADEVYKFRAICIDCGEEAWVSHRVTDNDEIIVVGDDEYVPLCRNCFAKRKALDKT